MKIAGIQKLTLLDFPGRCAATIFTPGCDLRCPFCHNASLVDPQSVQQAAAEGTFIEPQEILEFLKGRFGKLTGLAVTGGEPLMQDSLEEFLMQVKALGYAVKLDTNGTYPERLRRILASGTVDYVAMDLKNSREGYAKTAGIAEDAADAFFSRTLESMQVIKESGTDHEFRTTVAAQLHTVDDIRKLARLIAEGRDPADPQNASCDGPCNEKYFLQSFTDSGDILGDKDRGTAKADPPFTAHSKETMQEMLKAAREYVPKTQLRGL